MKSTLIPCESGSHLLPLMSLDQSKLGLICVMSASKPGPCLRGAEEDRLAGGIV